DGVQVGLFLIRRIRSWGSGSAVLLHHFCLALLWNCRLGGLRRGLRLFRRGLVLLFFRRVSAKKRRLEGSCSILVGDSACSSNVCHSNRTSVHNHVVVHLLGC